MRNSIRIQIHIDFEYYIQALFFQIRIGTIVPNSNFDAQVKNHKHTHKFET